MSSGSSQEVQQAMQLLKENRAPEAVVLLQSALKTTPDDFNINHLLGVALGKAGRRPEAIACLLKATRLNPGSAAAQTHLGLAYVAADKAELARQSLQTALNLDPNFAPAQKALAQLPPPLPVAPKAVPIAAPPMPAPPPAAPSPFSSSSHAATPVTNMTTTPKPVSNSGSSGSIRDEIAQAQRASKSEKYDVDWGAMGLQIAGAIVFVLGAFLWIGNVSGLFRTFPLAGWITMAIGGAMWKAA